MQYDQKDNMQVTTRSDDFHWQCQEEDCLFPLNGGWQDACSVCGKLGSSGHGNLLLTFKTILEASVSTGGGGPKFEKEDDNEGSIANRIVLPGGFLADYAPSPWHEAAKAQEFYNNLKTLGYYSDAAYAEGVDLGWYRTVRMLYPGASNLTKIETAHDRWLLGDGRKMKDSRGRGLKDGTKAAINAFGAR